MENASKALIMAGSVLIALIIIGALLLMFNNLSNYQNVETQTEAEAQVVAFNNQFETYNRKDVRGNDLYSLLNRVIDYNRRKSTEGKGATDEGQYLAYQPMTITYTLNGKAKDLTFDGTNRIFTDNTFTLNGETSNTFDIKVKNKISETADYATESGLKSLAEGISNLFPIKNEVFTIEQQLDAMKLWNRNVKSARTIKKLPDDIDDKTAESIKTKYKTELNTDDNRRAISIYYEFIQFKRARFECTRVIPDPKTGRIIQMDFSFTGKIE